MMICKLIQSLSNRVILKSKEDFMAPMLGFVEENVPLVDKFYTDIEVCLQLLYLFSNVKRPDFINQELIFRTFQMIPMRLVFLLL